MMRTEAQIRAGARGAPWMMRTEAQIRAGARGFSTLKLELSNNHLSLE
jgi:hypothetical protein